MPWRLLLAGLAMLAWLGAGPSPADAEGNTNKTGHGQPLPAPTAKSMAIEVISANYGHSGAPSSCVVTKSLKSSCNGKSRCIVNVGDKLCRPPNTHPAGLILTLTVEYKCTSAVATRIAKADKPFQLVIDCGASTR